MATIVPSAGSGWANFGQGLSQGLQQLAQIKMQQLMQKHQQRELEKTYTEAGIKPEWASVLSRTPEKERSGMFQMLPMLASLKQAGQMPTQVQPQKEEVPEFEEQPVQNQFQSNLDALSNMYSQPGATLPIMGNLIRQQEIPQQPIQQSIQRPTFMQSQVQPQITAQQTSLFKRPQTEEEIMSRAFEPPHVKFQRELAEAKAAQNRGLADEKYARQTWLRAHKERPKINETIKSDKELITDLNELINLNRTGKLIQGKEHLFLKSIGMEDFATNDVTQMAKKDIERMGVALMRTFKTGGRMTDFVAKTLKNTFPALLNTKSGFDYISKSVLLQTKLNLKYNEEQRKLEAMYERAGVAIPLEIDEQVAARVKPYEDAINQKRLSYIGRAMTQNPPDLAPKLKGLKDGTLISLYGTKLKKIDGEWIPQAEEGGL